MPVNFRSGSPISEDNAFQRSFHYLGNTIWDDMGPNDSCPFQDDLSFLLS